MSVKRRFIGYEIGSYKTYIFKEQIQTTQMSFFVTNKSIQFHKYYSL
jgi:hypothetical protein